MVAHARQQGIYTATSTNAHFLDEEKAEATVRSGSRARSSRWTAPPRTPIPQYRREGHLDQAIAGTERIVKWKRKLRSRTPHVVFQFLVVRPNEHQVPEARQLARRLGWTPSG